MELSAIIAKGRRQIHTWQLLFFRNRISIFRIARNPPFPPEAPHRVIYEKRKVSIISANGDIDFVFYERNRKTGVGI